jgi:dihydroxyacetone kinase-like predicted kinase
MGAYVLDGGPTLNPSTYDLLAGIHKVPCESVILLPNSPNVVMAAERAADLSDKQVYVVPTTAQQTGLSLCVAFESDRDIDRNVVSMQNALTVVRWGAVAPAGRDDSQGRFRRGEAIGFIKDELVVWGKPQPTLIAVLEDLANNAELLTCIAGIDAPLAPDLITDLAPQGIEVEHSDGGQPHYWWLLTAE